MAFKLQKMLLKKKDRERHTNQYSLQLNKAPSKTKTFKCRHSNIVTHVRAHAHILHIYVKLYFMYDLRIINELLLFHVLWHRSHTGNEN